jgi:hypothetical protein
MDGACLRRRLSGGGPSGRIGLTAPGDSGEVTPFATHLRVDGLMGGSLSERTCSRGARREREDMVYHNPVSFEPSDILFVLACLALGVGSFVVSLMFTNDHKRAPGEDDRLSQWTGFAGILGGFALPAGIAGLIDPGSRWATIKYSVGNVPGVLAPNSMILIGIGAALLLLGPLVALSRRR